MAPMRKVKLQYVVICAIIPCFLQLQGGIKYKIKIILPSKHIPPETIEI